MNSNNELKRALQMIGRKELTDTTKRIIGDHNYSEKDFNKKFAELRRKYPAYDELCKCIQVQHSSKESFIHATGMELLFRTLLTIANERDCEQ